MKRNNRYSVTADPPLCKGCGEEADLELSPRVDAPLVDPTYPVGSRFIFCSTACAKEAIERKV